MKLLLDFYKVLLVIIIWDLISLLISKNPFIIDWNIVLNYLLKVSIIFLMFLILKFIKTKK